MSLSKINYTISFEKCTSRDQVVSICKKAERIGATHLAIVSELTPGSQKLFYEGLVNLEFVFNWSKQTMPVTWTFQRALEEMEKENRIVTTLVTIKGVESMSKEVAVLIVKLFPNLISLHSMT
jgi:hypothetical protein